MATPATWKRRVAQWKSSGLTAAEFSAGRGYAAATLKWWSSRLNTGAASGGMRAHELEHPLVPLARLVVRAERVGPGEPGEPAAETPIVVEHGAVRLLLRRGFDTEALRRILHVLGAGLEGTP